MTKILSICMRAHSQSLYLLVEGRDNNVLLQTVPDINKVLKLINSVHTTVIHVHVVTAA